MHELRHSVAELAAAFPPIAKGRHVSGRQIAGGSVTSPVARALMGNSFLLPNHVADGEGRENTLLAYAGSLRSKGLSQAEIEAVLLAYNRTSIDPPLSEEVVLEKAARYAAQSQFIGTSAAVIQGKDGTVLVPSVPPPKREYAFSNQVTLGTLCTLGGSGGASKTMLALQMAVSSAVGKPLGGMQVAEGASLLFLGEEDHAERDRRIGGICAHFHADAKKVSRLVKCFPFAGKDLRLTMLVDGNPQETALVQEVIREAKEHEMQSGVKLKLIVFDHARLVLGGDSNAADHVTQLTRALTHIAHETGAAVVLLAHSPKSVLSKAGAEINAADIAGSSAFVDNSRATFMMYGMRPDEAKAHQVSESDRNQYVRLENVKANYARTGGGYWFRRTHLQDWDVAVLEHVSLLATSIFQGKAQSNLRQRILEEVMKKPAGLTVRKVRDMAGRDGSLGASEAKVIMAIKRMLEDGALEVRQPTGEERKVYRLTGQVKEVLVPGRLVTVLN